MAVTLVDTSVGAHTNDSGGIIVPSGSDRYLCSFLANDSTAPSVPSSVTHNAGALSAVSGAQAAETTGTGEWGKWWQRIAPDATSAEVLFNGLAGESTGVSAAFSGVDQTAPVEDVQITESAGATSLSETVTSGSADDMVVAGCSLNTNPTTTATGSATIRETAGGADYGVRLLTAPGAAGNVTLGISWTGAVRSSIVAYNVAAVGGGGAVIVRPSTLTTLGVQ